jgi:hypothetical protein
MRRITRKLLTNLTQDVVDKLRQFTSPHVGSDGVRQRLQLTQDEIFQLRQAEKLCRELNQRAVRLLED